MNGIHIKDNLVFEVPIRSNKVMIGNMYKKMVIPLHFKKKLSLHSGLHSLSKNANLYNIKRYMERVQKIAFATAVNNLM